QPAGDAGHIPIKTNDAAAVSRDLAGDQIEQRRLARPIGADDQPPLAGLDGEAHVAGDAQPTKGFAELFDAQRRHDTGSASLSEPGRVRSRNARQPSFHSRTEPGTSPSGMNLTMST